MSSKASTSVWMYYAAIVFLILAVLLAIFSWLCGGGCGGSWASGSSSHAWRDAVSFFFALAISLGVLALFQAMLDVESALQPSVYSQYFRAA